MWRSLWRRWRGGNGRLRWRVVLLLGFCLSCGTSMGLLFCEFGSLYLLLLLHELFHCLHSVALGSGLAATTSVGGSKRRRDLHALPARRAGFLHERLSERLGSSTSRRRRRLLEDGGEGAHSLRSEQRVAEGQNGRLRLSTSLRLNGSEHRRSAKHGEPRGHHRWLLSRLLLSAKRRSNSLRLSERRRCDRDFPSRCLLMRARRR